MSELSRQIKSLLGQVGQDWSAESRMSAYKGIIDDVLVYLDDGVLAEVKGWMTPQSLGVACGGGGSLIQLAKGRCQSGSRNIPVRVIIMEAKGDE